MTGRTNIFWLQKYINYYFGFVSVVLIIFDYFRQYPVRLSCSADVKTSFSETQKHIWIKIRLFNCLNSKIQCCKVLKTNNKVDQSYCFLCLRHIRRVDSVISCLLLWYSIVDLNLFMYKVSSCKYINMDVEKNTDICLSKQISW